MKLEALCLALALSLGASTAGAATLQLTQTGWDQGGPLTILFTGDDLDLSGAIDTNELSAFSATFQIAGGGTAAWTLADLGADGFYFASVDDYFIKADGPVHSLYEIALAGSPIGAFTDGSSGAISITGTPLQVAGAAAVPEPGTALMAALPLLALGVLRRRYSGS